MKRICVMASGGGSGFQTILDGCAKGTINGQVVRLIVTNAKVGAIDRAARAGVGSVVIAKRDFAQEGELHAARHRAIVECKPDLIVLAGYLGVLPADTIQAFEGRVINIHPALIPAFCGKGMYGRHVHEAVLEYGVKLSGATAHFANEAIDGGPVIAQRSVPVLDRDTPETLAARVLEVEHVLLPEVVALFCADRLVIEGRHVRVLGGNDTR